MPLSPWRSRSHAWPVAEPGYPLLPQAGAAIVRKRAWANEQRISF